MIEQPTEEQGLNSFETALYHLKRGDSVTRKGWNNDSIKVKLQRPDENSKMTLPYLYMEKWNTEGQIVRFPLDLSCESMLAEDWVILFK